MGFIRRKGVFLLILVIIYALAVNSRSEPCQQVQREVFESGTVKYTEEKKFSSQYILGDIMLISRKKGGCNIHTGDIVEFTGKEKDMGSMKIKDFDYGRHLKSRGIKSVVEIKNYKVVGENRFYKIIGSLRRYVNETNIYLYKTESGFLNAITTGDKSGIDKKTSYIFTDSGTSHVMAISGLHITILFGIAVFLIGKITSIPKFIAITIFLVFYSEFTGKSASVMRAVDLFIFSYICFFIDERVDILNVLSIIASVMILENTYVTYNLSFQLSFISVASMAIFTKYIEKHTYGKMLAASLAAMIGTFPIILYCFEEVSMAGFIGNIAAIPLTGVIIVLDLASVVLYYLIPFAGVVTAYINRGFIQFLMGFLKITGNFGVSNIVCKNMSFKYLAAYYIVLAAVGIFIYTYTIEKEKTYLLDKK